MSQIIIGKVVVEKNKYTVELISKDSEETIKKTLSNHCINFTKWQKVYLTDGTGPFVVKSNIPYLLEGEYYVDLTNNQRVNIKNLKKNKEVDIENNEYYYFTNAKKDYLVTYMGNLPKEIKHFVKHYFESDNKLIKNKIKNLLYEHPKVIERQKSLDNKLHRQEVSSELGN